METDKIGQGVYFWALPSKGRVHREKLLRDNVSGIERSQKSIENTQNAIEKATAEREDDGTRDEKLRRIEEMKERIASKRKELEVLDSCDSRKVDQMLVQVYSMREAANRWADNTYILKEYVLRTNPNCSHADLAIQFPQLQNMGMTF